MGMIPPFFTRSMIYLLLVNAAATVSNTIWNKVYITKYATETKEQTTYGISLIQQVETLPIFAALAYQDQEFARVGSKATKRIYLSQT